MQNLVAHPGGFVAQAGLSKVRTRRLLRLGISAALLMAVATAPARGAVISFQTPPGVLSLGGYPISAHAVFTTSTDTLAIVLSNLQPDTQILSQNLNGISFTIGTGQSSGSLSSSSALERKIHADGSFVDNGTVATGWLLGNVGSTFSLDQIGSSAAPTHTIVGPSTGSSYPDAKPSIAGAKLFNPFLSESATFVLNVPGLTSQSTITSATFTFGYTNCFSSVTVTLPEPGSLALATMGGLGLAVIAWRRHKARGARA